MSAPNMIEASRTHTVVGAFGQQGGPITALTNATPSVLTTTSAHGLIAGDPIQVSGVTTDTGANGNYPVTSVSGLNVTYPAAGNGVAGGLATSTLSFAYPISTIVTDWTLRLRIESLTVGKKIGLAVQDSADGFVSDIVTRATVSAYGQVEAAAYLDLIALRKKDAPSARFGVQNACLRVWITSIDAGATCILSCWVDA
jgi:hypothetical protein